MSVLIVEQNKNLLKLINLFQLFQGDYKLTPSEVREKLENISDEDAYLLGVNPEVARPEWMVLTVLPSTSSYSKTFNHIRYW